MSTDFLSFVLLKNIHTVVNIALQSDCQLFSYESPQSNCKIHPRKPTEKGREEERGARLLGLTGKQECISELRGGGGVMLVVQTGIMGLTVDTTGVCKVGV